jgi:hypothetical protein
MAALSSARIETNHWASHTYYAPVVGKNAIRKVELPEISGTNQLAVEQDRGWKPMIRSREGILSPES